VSKGRLTRQELGWLLTQEAQGAAERLRSGVTALTQPPPPPGVEPPDAADPSAVDATLSALDDTMKLLSSLHARPVGVRGRRGRIDLASLLWEVAPEANVSIEPGSGTEVFGDEAELRRMLHVMLGHGSGSGNAVTVRREGDEVVVGMMLGPDGAATSQNERAWLARMAVRHGGRYGLEGNTEVLALPAEGIEERDDVAKLRKELDEARKQGEAYARELAAVYTGGDEPMVPSTYPPPHSPAAERSSAVGRFAGGIAAALRAVVAPLAREVAELRIPSGPRKSSPEIDVTARGDFDDPLEAPRRKLASLQELVTELTLIGEADPLEPVREVDLAEIVRGELRGLEARARRAGIDVVLQTTVGDANVPNARVAAKLAPRQAAILTRQLVAYAIAATPRGSGVVVTLRAADRPGEGNLGPRLTVDDGGTILPAAARRALLALEVEPGTFGRPSSVPLFAASDIAAAQGALLELGDAPPAPAAGTEGGSPSSARGVGGGMRSVVTFPR
jgi:signal transduction histidine kinase